ncbi:tetratricopeptide repeat protein, partial [bacterium]|nr:tetratricopeptide repeat protein [bacterium]
MSEILDKALELFSKKDYKNAIDAFHVVLENEDESAEIYNNIGVSYSNLGDYKNAETYLNKALNLNP